MEKQKIIRIDFNMEIREHFNYNPDEGYLYKIPKYQIVITKVRKIKQYTE